jgi:hypothetical protein
MPFLISTEMFKIHLLNLFAYLLSQLPFFHYEELEAFESFGLALNFCSYIPALSTHTQNFNTTLSSLEFQRNPKTKTLGEVRKCIDSNTFPSFTQFFFFSIMLALTCLCLVFYFLPKHGVPT